MKNDEKTKEKFTTLSGIEFGLSDLKMPRVLEDRTITEEDYYHWSALEIMFKELYPSGGPVFEEIEDNERFVKFKCSLYASPQDERPLVTYTHKMIYDDSPCEIYNTCQTMSYRWAMIVFGIGVEKVLETEKAKRQRSEEKLADENRQMTPEELFDVLTAKKNPPKEEEVKKVDPFEAAPTRAEMPVEETKPDPPKEEKEEAKEPEPPEPKKKRGRKPKSEKPGPDYIIKPEDFTSPMYARRYKGKKLGEINNSTLRAFLTSKGQISDDFKAVIEKTLE